MRPAKAIVNILEGLQWRHGVLTSLFESLRKDYNKPRRGVVGRFRNSILDLTKAFASFRSHKK